MNQNILKYLRKYSHHEQDINKLLVSSFLKINNLVDVDNSFINEFIITENEEKEYSQLLKFVQFFDSHFDIELLLELFEFVISPADKEVNGAVYTPRYIREYIVKKTIEQFVDQGGELATAKFADIACGCGGFFKTIVEEIKNNVDKSYFDMYRDNIYGIDIQPYSIGRTKILLTLLSIVNGEDEREFEFNFFEGDSLEYDWSTVPVIRRNGGFDIIVGNPPYVGARKMDESTKLLLRRWSVTDSGKPDLYIPFFQIAIENLNRKGILGFITVNTFQKSLNARSLRAYFSSNGVSLRMIDFGGEQLFKGRSTYTCICIISNLTTNEVYYTKSKSAKVYYIKESDYVKINYNQLDDFNGWYLIDNKVKSIIDKIESTGKALGNKFEIRNGFATLKNKVYVFRPIKADDEFYYLKQGTDTYKIEKEVCRDAIKPNILKSESEIDNYIDKVIFPYTIEKVVSDMFGSEKKVLKTIPEEIFSLSYPYAYKYLLTNKESLSQRDKGNREYDKWYAFGRNQALTLSGYKLFLPYITENPCFVFCDNFDLLFYNGYAIFSDNAEDLLVLQKVLMSKVFWFYIENTSRPYSGNYYSVAKNYIKRFGVCSLNTTERQRLLNIPLIQSEEIDRFLCAKYNIEYELIS